MWGRGRVQAALPKPSPQGTQVASEQLWQVWLLPPPVPAWCQELLCSRSPGRSWQEARTDPTLPVPTRPAPARLLLLQVEVDGPSTSMELHGLTSGTEYLLSVFPMYEAGVGEGLRGLVTTGGWGSWLLWVLV